MQEPLAVEVVTNQLMKSLLMVGWPWSNKLNQQSKSCTMSPTKCNLKHLVDMHKFNACEYSKRWVDYLSINFSMGNVLMQ